MISSLSDRALSELLAAGLAEQRRRAVEGGDLDALIVSAHSSGFDARGRARIPWITNGVLVCPGSIVGRSALSHECSFVSIDGTWVWEFGDLILDDVRKINVAGKEHQRSISLVPALEGMELDVVASRMRTGAHHVQKVLSYQIVDGALELVKTRSPKSPDHR